MKENTINIKTWLPHALALSFAVVVYVVLTHLPARWRARTFSSHDNPRSS